MITKGQVGTFRPKVNIVTKHPLSDDVEHTSTSQALADSCWREVMSDEFTTLLRHGTWDLVPAPQNVNFIGNKWIFRIKRKSDGSIDRYKARLVAKGFHQRPGVDYNETFSPVVKPVTIRAVLSLALMHAWPLKQLDISNAFLHGHLEEPVYMSQPSGFVDPNFPNHVCRLRKSLYGLKQAPRAWYQALSSALLTFGFHQSLADTSLFTLHKDGVHLFVLVFVDDLIITGSSSSHLADLTSHLQRHFALKDLGPLSYFLGIEVATCHEGLFLSQYKYTIDLLRRHNLEGCKPVSTPMASKINPPSNTLADAFEYRRAIGGLQYLTLTRPDITFAVSRLAQSMASPSDSNWVAVKHLFRYLKGTLHHGLLLRRPSDLSITAYSDSDFGGSLTDGRSTSAYIIFLGPNPISWRSRKQSGVARSSTEAEYRSLATAAAEVCWIKHLFRDLGILSRTTPKLLCDNITAT